MAPPFVSFVMPTRGRDTANTALASVRQQEDEDWEFVGVNDPRVTWNGKPLSIGAEDWTHRNDEQVLLVGGREESAGLLRNQGIKHTNQSKWIAFIDDDDAVDPAYVTNLRLIDEEEPGADCIIFGMQYPDGTILPDPSDPRLEHGCVGISFAVRRQKFFGPNKVQFIRENLNNPGVDGNEDINLLRQLMAQDATIIIHPEPLYFVRPHLHPNRLRLNYGS